MRVKDPKGYYGVLGITPKADIQAVKRAYRTRAKVLHPDRNPSPRAVAEFQFLHEAYRVLSDPEARAHYDRVPSPLATRVAWSTARRRERANPVTGTAAFDDSQTYSDPNAPRVCQVCGRVTTEPRYLVVHRVRGLGLRVEQRPIRGVFCRVHGDRTAVAASLYCWGLGWWALPWGPIRTIQALWRNLPGGEHPAAENYRLLMHQARAFLARGNLPLARSQAEQSLRFARTDEDRRNARRILEALADQPRIKAEDQDSWRGSVVLAQVAPLLLLISVALYIVGPTRVIGGLLDPLFSAITEPAASQQRTAAAEPRVQGPFTGTTQPAPSPGNGNRPASRSATPAPAGDPAPPKAGPVIGRLYAVRPPSLPVRSGPGDTYQVLATLSRDTVLMVTEVSPDGRWGRVLSARGVSGFVPADSLEPTMADSLTR